MKLSDGDIELRPGEHGFEGKDVLERQLKGKQLSSLVETISDSMVIAVDGPWGTGKSFFLKCWVGAHKNENPGTTETIYFDAFKHDYFDDPLVAITSVVLEHIKDTDDLKTRPAKRIKAMAVAASKSPLTKAALKTMLKVGTLGATEIVEAASDVAIKTMSDELSGAIDDYWKHQESRRKAMDGFRAALLDWTLVDPDNPRKLVIAVDELDRCRPDFALALLETIKHFFDVPNVHFVLGVNLEELSKSVKMLYGSDASSQYLQKFITLTMRLPDVASPARQNEKINLEYLKHKGGQVNLSTQFVGDLSSIIDRPSVDRRLALRDINRILFLAKILEITIPNLDRRKFGWKLVLFCALIMKVVDPPLYHSLIDGRAGVGEVRDFFDLKEMYSGEENERYDDRFGAILNTALTQVVDSSQSGFERRRAAITW